MNIKIIPNSFFMIVCVFLLQDAAAGQFP